MIRKSVVKEGGNREGRKIMNRDSFCKIYIFSNLDYDNLFNLILKRVNGKKEAISCIRSDWCEACLKKNKEYSEEYYLSNKEDFIYWNYYLDIEASENAGIADFSYIKKIRELIICLRDFCDGVVASCDFEEFL